jgi:hypothetical protein
MIRIKRITSAMIAGAAIALSLSAVTGSIMPPAASAHTTVSAMSGTAPQETPWG